MVKYEYIGVHSTHPLIFEASGKIWDSDTIGTIYLVPNFSKICLCGTGFVEDNIRRLPDEARDMVREKEKTLGKFKGFYFLTQKYINEMHSTWEKQLEYLQFYAGCPEVRSVNNWGPGMISFHFAYPYNHLVDVSGETLRNEISIKKMESGEKERILEILRGKTTPGISNYFFRGSDNDIVSVVVHENYRDIYYHDETVRRKSIPHKILHRSRAPHANHIRNWIRQNPDKVIMWGEEYPGLDEVWKISNLDISNHELSIAFGRPGFPRSVSHVVNRWYDDDDADDDDIDEYEVIKSRYEAYVARSVEQDRADGRLFGIFPIEAFDFQATPPGRPILFFCAYGYGIPWVAVEYYTEG